MSSKRQLPNIIICGTPGVGKSRLCQELCSLNKSLKYININELAKQNKLLLGYDEENQCEILNDDAINDYLENEYFQQSSSSTLIIDYHSAGMIPDHNYVQGVFVLHCSIDKLNDRLKNRNYSQKKLQEILQAENFQVCLNEAREAFDETIVYKLINETDEDFKRNVEYLLKWINQWPLIDMID